MSQDKASNASLALGEIVTLKVGETTYECMVLRNDGGLTTLVPIESASDIPIDRCSSQQVEVQSEHGVHCLFDLSERNSIDAVHGVLKPMESINNRRESYRVPVEFRSDVSTDEGQSWTQFQGDSLSEGGASFRGPAAEITFGQKLRIRMYLPHTPAIEVYGVVVRADNKRIRLRFVSVDAEVRRTLARFIYCFEVKRAPCRVKENS